MKAHWCLFAVALFWFEAGAVIAAGPANLVVNGDFEQNGGLGTSVFTGWTVFNETGSSGSWYAQMGTVPGPVTQSCAKTVAVPEPPSGFAAMTTQSDPGSHILYQDVTIPSGASSVTLSFDLYLNSASDFAVPVPPTLDFHQKRNQQFRVDLLDPSAPVTDAGAGVLASLFHTEATDSTVYLAYARHTYDLSSFAGRTVRLRFAEVDNIECISAGIDNVSITAGACPTSVRGSVVVAFHGDSTGCTASATKCAAGEAISFSALGISYTFQACDTYSWDFGDGGVSSLRSPNHAYAAAGSYTVRLTVANSLGSSAAGAVVVSVGPPPPRRRAVGH
jgi:chitodextrinase